METRSPTPRLSAILVLGLTALAILPARAASTGSFSVDYDGFSHGLLVLRMTASLTLTPNAYEGHIAYHTAGMIGWMVHNNSDNTVTGRFDGGKAVPTLFESAGRLRGTDRQTRITYDHGNPIIQVLTPAVETERSPVPPNMTAHTIDTMSAIAMLVRQVAETGRCDGSATTFDGRRLTSMVAHTTGSEVLPKADRSIFQGDTLRCDFDGNELAGFVKSESEAQQRRTRHGTAWLAKIIPGAPPVPVRVTFENKILGQVTLYLTAVDGVPGVMAQNRPAATPASSVQ